DGWFMGLTPDLVAGVWVGGEDRSVRFRSLRLGMGTNMALPIWGYYMNKVYDDSTLNISTSDFDRPTGKLEIQLDCNQYRANQDGNWDLDDAINDAEQDYYGDF
ncbi:MAG: penicillin-binding protein, partial [Flavobacteriales bacterium]|nr:penicillin-binding protein [Flavobacteriales bacterium]